MFEATGAGTMVIFFRGAVPTLCSCLRATNGKRGIETYTDPCPKYRGIQGLLQIKLQIKIKSLSRFTLSPGDSQFHIISEAFFTCH